jgi:hypothetical protein
MKGRTGGLRLSQGTKKSDGRLANKTAVEMTSNEESRRLVGKEKEFFDALPEDGSFITNYSLRLSLRRKKFTTKDFWDVRKKLLDDGKIQVGMGQGGRTAKAHAYTKALVHEKHFVERESELWQHVTGWLRDNEKKRIEQDASSQSAFAKVFVADTSKQKETGQWSNPDVMLVSILNFECLPQKRDLVVYTYEVKKHTPVNLGDVKNVFEAASHQKGAHYSYLVVENDEEGSNEPPPPELFDTLERFGVGFAWFCKVESDSARRGEYYMRVAMEPELQNPARENVNKYILRFIAALSEREKGDFKTSIG